MSDLTYHRFLEDSLARRLDVMPAVVVTGARQVGKSTLVRKLGGKKRAYRSLDDLDIREMAQTDPSALLGGPGPVTIDEVQREPRLLDAVKRAIDDDRRAGRFLLTGSANLLLMRRVSESLAGRASYLTLRTMTRREQRGEGRCGLWDELFAACDDEWLSLLEGQPSQPEDWRVLVRRGGFPTPAIHMTRAADRQIWFDGYVRTYLERDLLDLSSVASLPDFRRLMRAACHRLGRMLNQTELGRDVAMPQPTVHRYLNLLETSYLLHRLPAYAVNRTKRLMKSPKLYWGDTGVALHLSGGEPLGEHLENLVLLDLLAWRDGNVDRPEIHYWRTTTGAEVDFVVEWGDQLMPIEIKASGRPRLGDARHLRTFRQEYGARCRSGLLLHGGKTLTWLASDVLAAPWWRVI